MTKSLSQILQKIPEKKTFILKDLGMATPVERMFNNRVLKAHPVSDFGEPFDNDDSFSAKDVKTFDRAAHHYGHTEKDVGNIDKLARNDRVALKTANIPVLQQEEKKYLRDVVEGYKGLRAPAKSYLTRYAKIKTAESSKGKLPGKKKYIPVENVIYHIRVGQNIQCQKRKYLKVNN